MEDLFYRYINTTNKLLVFEQQKSSKGLKFYLSTKL